MRIAVTGSIAEDYLMTYGGRFADVIVPEEIDNLSLSFLVEDLTVQRGGVAANICFGLGLLGQRPLLVGAVGDDFQLSYERWLEQHGVDTSAVHVSEERHTARFLCTTDNHENQIASFYPGAMSEASGMDVADIVRRHDDVGMVLVGPNDPDAMVRHSRDAREAGIPLIADPSQQLPMLEGDQIRELVDGAAYLVANAYEASLIARKTGWSDDEVRGRVGTRVTTRSAEGIHVEPEEGTPFTIPAVPAEEVVDPTGVGDAFRGGFFSGVTEGLDPERSAQLGALVAVHAVEVSGPQSYVLDAETALSRFKRAYGADAADDVAPVLDRLEGPSRG